MLAAIPQTATGRWLGFVLVFFFSFPAFRKHQLRVGDEKLETTEAKSVASVLESKQKRISCSARHASFGLRFCVCHAQPQVRLVSTSSTIIYSKDRSKPGCSHPDQTRFADGRCGGCSCTGCASRRQGSISLPRCRSFCFIMEMYQDTFKFSPALTGHASTLA